MAIADFEESMNIMFWGTYTTTMAVLPQMLERHEGRIVTTVAPGLMRTGSTVNAIVKGEKHHTEYTLFTLLDTLPYVLY